ncbi:hypothetical protein EG68_03463 [Paragonimus skrjabini miyazakii]|uniref:Uncharacterized protein n=1 Tax=Paragonimus skrjabini miyazakii TaxID=59628 RepID=A0A8S9Z3L5_9TREM|nr:hypothetical protein EG68_03463 [Paragonimus skrjabini miyazakii]
MGFLQYLSYSFENVVDGFLLTILVCVLLILIFSILYPKSRWFGAVKEPIGIEKLDDSNTSSLSSSEVDRRSTRRRRRTGSSLSTNGGAGQRSRSRELHQSLPSKPAEEDRPTECTSVHVAATGKRIRKKQMKMQSSTRFASSEVSETLESITEPVVPPARADAAEDPLLDKPIASSTQPVTAEQDNDQSAVQEGWLDARRRSKKRRDQVSPKQEQPVFADDPAVSATHSATNEPSKEPRNSDSPTKLKAGPDCQPSLHDGSTGETALYSPVGQEESDHPPPASASQTFPTRKSSKSRRKARSHSSRISASAVAESTAQNGASSAINSDSHKLEFVHSVEAKTISDDSEFEVIEIPTMMTSSPEPSASVTESDPDLTDLGLDSSSPTVVAPSPASLAHFPCLPGSENQFACVPVCGVDEVREGGRHPLAGRLLSSALTEIETNADQQPTAVAVKLPKAKRSRVRKAD